MRGYRSSKRDPNRCRKAQHHGKDCGASGVLKPKQASWQTEHHTVLRAYRERRSLRGVTRLFAMARQTGARWLTTHVQNLPEVKESLLPAAPEEVLDLEEMWRGVRNKEQARWVWTAMAAEAATSSPWSLETEARATCLRLWQALADGSKPCHPFRDCWHASPDLFPAETPPAGGKETGQTAQRERGNTTFR